jgi:hypothetical protein
MTITGGRDVVAAGRYSQAWQRSRPEVNHTSWRGVAAVGSVVIIKLLLNVVQED